MQSIKTNYAFPFYSFLFVFYLSAIATFAQIKCDYCSKAITEDYIIVEEKTFHNNHFLCSICKKPINSKYFREGDKFFDADCYVKNVLPKCNQCNKPIDGKYFEKDNQKYHEDCYLRYKTEKCAICGEPILSEYKIDQFSNKYHTHHEINLTRCDNCFQIITQKLTDGGVIYSDGRNICNICAETAISGAKEVNRKYKIVLSKLGKMGLIIDDNNIEVFNTNRINLKKIAAEHYSNNLGGYCKMHKETTTIGNHSSVKLSFKVYIIDGIPLEYLESVIAHELMHVWIYQNTNIKHTSKLVEGSCNYISYLYLKDKPGKIAQHAILNLKSNSNKIYGDGFRSVYNKFSNKKLNFLLEYLKLYSEI